MTMNETGYFGIFLLILIVLPAHCADWPDCKFQCQANDVIVSRLWLGDDMGDELSYAVAGEKQSCYLWATLRNNANAPRYAAILLADLYLDDALSRSFYDDGLCVLEEIEAKSTVDHPLYNIIWTGGEEVRLKRLVLSWETAKGTTCSQANRRCSNRNTKCYGGPEAELVAETPLSASFTENPQACSGAVKFADQTSGGDGPYTYDWDFGDALYSNEKNPDHTYDRPGNYTVRLQAKDQSGRVASLSRQLAINVCPCSIIGQDHSCLGKTETYRVSLTDSIRGTIQWYLDGREIDDEEAQEGSDESHESHDAESIDIDWHNYGAGQHELMAYVNDKSTMNRPTLWAACNMTITVTPEPVAVIGWVV
ncbi:MAG: PKD domain-containing protein [Methanothrix sp.]|nr:PKD domain-containing protein [Methanothrix sp.]